MPKEIWNEGRVVGLSAYELYVKQHLAEDPDTPVATEREWLASSLGMGSSMILKFPNTSRSGTKFSYDNTNGDSVDRYIDIPLPAGSKLAAANSIVATFFDGDVSSDNMIDDYWARRVDSYGTGIQNTFIDAGQSQLQIRSKLLSEVLDSEGYTPVRLSDIPVDQMSDPPKYIIDNDGIKYICLGKQCGYAVGDSIELSQETGEISLYPDASTLIESLGPNFSNKYLKFMAQFQIWKPHPILENRTVIHISIDLSTYTNYGLSQFGEGIYLRLLDGIYAELVYSEAERYVDGEIHTNDIQYISKYPSDLTKIATGQTSGDWVKTTRNRLSDYLKIEDGIVIQPGTWTESEYFPPASDFEVNLKERPVLRFRVRGEIKNNPLIILTGFTVRYVLCGTLGQDTATNTESPQDGDFLGPAVFPWCNKILFTVPDSYVSLFEKNYLNTRVQPGVHRMADQRVRTPSSDDVLLSNKVAVYFVQDLNTDKYDYFTTSVETDKNLFIQSGNDETEITKRKINYSRDDLRIYDYASLNNKQSVFLINNRNRKFPPSLYSGTIKDNTDTSMYPVDVSAPGTIKMLHETEYNTTTTQYGSREDAPYELATEYETYYPGTNAIVKKYNDGTLWTIDNRKVKASDTYEDSMIPVSKVDHYNMRGFIDRNSDGAFIYDPKTNNTKIDYKVVTSGRDSISLLPFGNVVESDEEIGSRDSTYLMSTKNSPILEQESYSDPDFITWYDIIRSLAGNRKIDLLGKALRDFKHSLEDGDNGSRVLNVYKCTITPSKSSAGDPGPGDKFGDGTFSLKNGNIFSKIKLDVMGYAQRYDDGAVGTGEVSTRTNNFISTLSVYANNPSGKYTFNTHDYTERIKVSRISNFSGTYESSGDVSISANDASIYKPSRSVGVNAWIQRIQISNKTSIYNILKLLRQMYGRSYYNCTNKLYATADRSWEVRDNNQTGGISSGEFTYTKSTGDIQLHWRSTGQDFLIEGANSGKPAVGYYEYYTSDGTFIMLNVVKDYIRSVVSGVDTYDVVISWGNLVVGDNYPKTFIFTGSLPVFDSGEHAFDLSGSTHNNYMIPGEVTFVIDVSTALAYGSASTWMSRLDFDESPETYFSELTGSLNGYIYGKSSGDGDWKGIGDTAISGSIMLSKIEITNSDYRSSGTMKAKDGAIIRF